MLGIKPVSLRRKSRKLAGIIREYFKHLCVLSFDSNLVFAFYYAAIDHSYI